MHHLRLRQESSFMFNICMSVLTVIVIFQGKGHLESIESNIFMTGKQNWAVS